jgi:hypothetical protein
MEPGQASARRLPRSRNAGRERGVLIPNALRTTKQGFIVGQAFLAEGSVRSRPSTMATRSQSH